MTLSLTRIQRKIHEAVDIISSKGDYFHMSSIIAFEGFTVTPRPKAAKTICLHVLACRFAPRYYPSQNRALKKGSSTRILYMGLT